MFEKNIYPKKPSERLEDLIGRLVLKDSLWGYLFSKVTKREILNDPSLTIGVGPTADGIIVLDYNSDFINLLNDKDLEIVLQHEGMHLLNKHISRLFRIITDEVDNFIKSMKIEVWNIAADCNANDLIGAPDSFILRDGSKFELIHPKKYNFPINSTSEFYFYKLLEKYKAQNKNIQQYSGETNENNKKQNNFDCQSNSGSNKNDQENNVQRSKNKDGLNDNKEINNFKFEKNKTLDSHDSWGKSLSEVPDASTLARKIEQFTQEVIYESYNSVRNKGNIPGGLKTLIEDLLKPPEIPYYQIIKKLVQGSKLSKNKKAYSRVNRKRGYAFLFTGKSGLPILSPFPGKVKDFTFKISLLTDTSGSMTKDDILESLKGIKHIIENDKYCETTVIHCDTRVNHEYKVKKISDIDFNIYGRGGTILAPGLFRCKELKTDVTLVFTDGYCDNINNIDKKMLPNRIIWVLTNNGIIDNINKIGFIVRMPKKG